MRPCLTKLFFSLVLISILTGSVFTQDKMEVKDAGGTRAEEPEMSERRNMKLDNKGLGISQIGQIAISVSDLEGAVAFYRDKLGLKYLFTANGMAFFDCDGLRLMLASLENEGSVGANFVVYFKVDDMQKTYKALSDRGVKFDEEPELAARTEKFDLWLACFRDPEKNNLCLMSEVGRE